MQLSIIVPVYNVEQYIERCLESLVYQGLDYSEYEIVIIDDGSKDSSIDLVKKWLNNYSNIRLIQQANKGLSGARNTGIRNALGEFIMFVDSDDYLEKNVLTNMLEFARKHSLEISMFGMNLIENGQIKKLGAPKIKEFSILNGIELYFTISTHSACKYLLLNSFVKNNDLYFFEKAVFLEDAEWSSRIFALAKRTAYLDLYFYNYEIRPNSLVTSNAAYSDKAFKGYIQSAINLQRFQKSREMEEVQFDFVNHSIVKFALLPLNMCISANRYMQFIGVIKNIRDAGFGKFELKGVRRENRRQAFFYNLGSYPFFLYLVGRKLMKSVIYKLNRLSKSN